jgi:hypothetical protein
MVITGRNLNQKIKPQYIHREDELIIVTASGTGSSIYQENPLFVNPARCVG